MHVPNCWAAACAQPLSTKHAETLTKALDVFPPLDVPPEYTRRCRCEDLLTIVRRCEGCERLAGVCSCLTRRCGREVIWGKCANYGDSLNCSMFYRFDRSRYVAHANKTKAISEMVHKCTPPRNKTPP